MDLRKIGQARLCLRLPARRDQLQSHDALALDQLFESYATTTQERDSELQISPRDSTRLTDLEAQCAKIEEKVCLLLDVVRMSRAGR
ncbi:hypothetical protein BC360_23180 [Ensifer sp. LC163]|nr:hypothetical protein BC360_23180 [Ensifer sp. LC163]